MQYILVKREKVKDKAYHETMPDGRVILPFSAVKMSGVLEGVTIVPSGVALKAMILAQQEAGVKPPQEDLPEGGDGIVSEGGETNADGGDGDYVDFEPVGDGNTENADVMEEAGEEPTEGEEVQGEEAENGSGDGSGDGGKVSEDSETNPVAADEPEREKVSENCEEVSENGKEVSENGETNNAVTGEPDTPDGEKVSEGEETNSDEESLTEKDNLMEDIDL